MSLAARFSNGSPRLVAGLMSGTSTDGVDVALARIAGSERDVQIEMLGFGHHDYDDILRETLLRNAEASTSSVRELALLDMLLARRFDEAIRQVCIDAGVDVGSLDAIGSHGHTFQHIPDAQALAGEWVAASLQLGSGSALAVLTGTPVVSDFRVADVTLGGQGAPLVPYFDWALMAHPDENRLLLNLGGIANLTVLPAGAGREDVVALDTGPANMVLDALARRLLGKPFDQDGSSAARGTVDQDLLGSLLSDPYFSRPPPKSTGRERFGAPYVERLIASGKSSDDLLATATALTVRSVVDAVDRFVHPDLVADVLIISGGGLRNRTLMAELERALPGVPVKSSREYGIDPAAKESLCFALLAHEFLNGVPTNLPRVTGASREVVLGVLAVG